MTATTLAGTLWLVWLAYWLLAAGFAAKTVAQQPSSSRIAHSVFIWAGAALLFSNVGRLGILERPLLSSGSGVGWAGVIVVAAGLGFSAWARMHLGRLWSGSVTLKEEHAIVRTGPYGLTRHPIYTGLLLALIGTVLVRGTLGAVLGFLLIAIGIWVKVRQEEQLLISHFGDAYRAYRTAVPALVPRPWPSRA